MSAITELIPCTNNKNGNFEFVHAYKMYDNLNYCTVMITNRVLWNPNHIEEEEYSSMNKGCFTVIVKSFADSECYKNYWGRKMIRLDNFNTELACDYSELITPEVCYSALTYKGVIITISDKATFDSKPIQIEFVLRK